MNTSTAVRSFLFTILLISSPAFSQPVGPKPPLDVKCFFDVESHEIHISWANVSPECCEKYRVEDGTGKILVSEYVNDPAKTGNSSHRFSCDELEALRGTLCVVCIAPDGMERRECCDYTCDDPCPKQYRIDCDYSDPNLAVRIKWAPTPPADCCERIIVGAPDTADPTRPGVILANLPGTASEISVTCTEIHAAGLPLFGTLCVWCEDGMGLNGAKTLTLMGCCDYSCRDCPDPGILCTTTNDGVVFSWNANVPPDCCESFLLRVPSNPPQVLATLPNLGTVTTATVNCESLKIATGQTSGVVCLVCVAPDGSETEVCCDWSCPDPCDPEPVQILRCELNAADNLELLWNQHSRDCCDKFLVTVNGLVAVTAGAGATTASIADFCKLYGPGVHEICVICIDPDTGAPVSKDCCKIECGGDCDIRVTCDPTKDPMGMPAVSVSWATSGDCHCDRFLITFGADAITVPGSVTSVTIPCAKLPGTGGAICVRCLRTDGTTAGVGCCDYQCPQDDPPCPDKCTYEGCNRVKSTTWLCPDQFDFEVFISLRTICGNMVVKSCRPSFRLSDIGFSNGHFMTLQQKCRALVEAINNDPCCQALGYKVLPGDDRCDMGPDGCFCVLGSQDCPWFVVTDTLCPSGQLVMGISNDPNVLDQHHQGPLPDYEAEHIQTLWGDPTPGENPNGDEPGATVTLEGEATGEPVVSGNGLGGARSNSHLRLTLSIGNSGDDSDFNVVSDVLLATKAGDSAEDLVQIAAILIESDLVLRKLRGKVEARGKTLTVSNVRSSIENGAAAGISSRGNFGFSFATNDNGISFGTNVGSTCALDGDPSDCPTPPSTVGGAQQPGDMDGSGTDFSDHISILSYLFLGDPELLPCGDGSIGHPSNLTLLDADGSGNITFGDPIHMLKWQFLGGRGHAEGEDCIRIPLCSDDSKKCDL